MIERLDWDSEFFGIEVGKIVDSPFSDVMNINQFDFLYVFNGKESDTGAPNFLKSYEGFHRVYQKMDLTFQEVVFPEVHSARNLDFNLDDLYTLAFISGSQSRYNRDAQIPSGNFKLLYKTWIDNSLNKTFAEDVLLYIENKKIEGFITYKNHNKYSKIGLFAVNAGKQGKGIGKKLLKTVENKLAILNISELRIPTQQENKQACAFYEKMGYKLNDTYLVQHFWKV